MSLVNGSVSFRQKIMLTSTGRKIIHVKSHLLNQNSIEMLIGSRIEAYHRLLMIL